MKIKKPFSCGLGPVLDLIGGRWKATILYELSQKEQRFGELRRNIEGITEKMLTQQLREMETHGLVIRKDYQEKPLRVGYTLSEEGEKINELMVTLADWGHEYSRKVGIIENYDKQY